MPYQGMLLFRLICLVTSTVLILSNILIILLNKLQKVFAIRLFLYLSLAQLLIFIPILLNPFILSFQEDLTQDTIIPPTQCQVQGSLVMLGWQMATYISIFMSYSVTQALQGRAPVRNQKQEYKIISVFFSLALILILFTLFAGDGYRTMGSHIGGTKYYYFCNSTNIQVIFITATLDIALLIFAIILSIKIRFLQIGLDNLGFQSGNLLVNVNKFSLSQLALSTINLSFKFMDNQLQIFPDPQSSIFYEIVWQIGNNIYDIEGILVTLIFHHLFLYRILYPKSLKRQLQKMFPFKKKKKPNQKQLIHDQSILLSDEEYIEDSSIQQ